ncbi:MAG: 16S rRNA (cytosine(1402)-N(4))-methyltransferase RsmH [Chitinophagaceae bacterium]
MSANYHIPVLYSEVLEALQIKPNGIYVDATFGGGGHSKGILERLGKDGRLIAFDQDADAEQNIPVDEDRLLFVPHNFKHLQRFLKLYKIDSVDGVLADLGVSSHQFDVGTRGFSTRFDGPLDMRMDTSQVKTAKQVIETYSQKDLQFMFQEFGQVTNSKTLAEFIVKQRASVKLHTINDFKMFISSLVKGNPNKYLAQVFQAVRMEVNDELGVLKEFLSQLPQVLKQGGIAAIITFHSGEDRLVKNFFKEGSFEEVEENPFAIGSKEKVFKALTKKPVEASEAELQRNTRSRSAKLRVVQKL